MIGDKTDILNLCLSGYVKFLNDCGLIHENQNAFIKKELNRIRSEPNFNNIINNPNFDNDYIQLSNVKSNANILNAIPKGKISKNDIYIVFNQVCGLKNFENKKRNQSQVNSNSFVEGEFSKRSIDLSEKCYLNTNREFQLSKMNFPLFLKSFEYLSKKIHWNSFPEKAFELFLDVDLSNILKIKSETITLKKNLIDNLMNLRSEEIVFDNFYFKSLKKFLIINLIYAFKFNIFTYNI
jgi:hypothetical protein